MQNETAAGPLWSPDPAGAAAAPMGRFLASIAANEGSEIRDYRALHSWSVGDVGGFWSRLWDFCGIIGDKGEPDLIDGHSMMDARFFPDARLNYAENILRNPGPGDAIIFRGEDKVERRISWEELAALVSRFQKAFIAAGIGEGDRVAAMMPNMPETIIAMLAASSIGAVWSSCSPDFGAQGVLDRFGQIEPKLMIACDGYWYNGKRIEVAEKLKTLAERLPTASAIVIVPYLDQAAEVASQIPKAVPLDEFLSPHEAAPVTFGRFAFDHPLYILFSSGTTGVPKCIVHGQGGSLLQHMKEIHLHCGVENGDRLFYFTTCGWMMWNWLASGLGAGATLLLYDGSPFYPDGNALFDYAQAEKMTIFGTSAKFIDAVRNAGLAPSKTHDLSSLRMMTSTGSTLAPENYDFVYASIKSDIHLASISGGTDIVSCFVLGNPLEPVWRGEIQGPGLGMAMDVWDDAGNPVRGQKGELVCTRPFVSQPVRFWNDPGNEKYRDAYFNRFDNIWCHGDFAEWSAHGGIIIHGRSDATLNPGGVRIGTAEIYNQVEQLPEILEGLAIGQDWDRDVRVVLFVKLAPGIALDDDLESRIRTKIRTGASPRHVPAKIVAVGDIPRTKSGKITELAVRDIVHGRPVKNREALANPEALELYRDVTELSD